MLLLEFVLLTFKVGCESSMIFKVISGERKVPELRIKSKGPCVLMVLWGWHV